MSHSIEELERQLQSARDRWRQAQDDVRAAETRLQDARNEASGVLGHVLEYTVTRGYRPNVKTVTKRLIVDKVTTGWRRSADVPPPLRCEGYFVIAGGKKGVMRGTVDLPDAKDLGPFVDPITQEQAREAL